MSLLSGILVTAMLAATAFAGLEATPVAASSAIAFDASPGSGAPPSTLGGFAMASFSSDPQPVGMVSGVNDPAGPVTFSPSLDHRLVGQGWATWSHGYSGDVYWSSGATTVTIGLPSRTSAFYLYAEPNPFATFTMTAVTDDGTSSGPVDVNGYAGARYFGFYATASESIATITVSSAVDFAVGEFGIATKPIQYVALGDSYASGEGAGAYDTDAPKCDRSAEAWPRLMSSASIHLVGFFACSGAKTTALRGAYAGQPSQLDSLAKTVSNQGVDAITVTIGGDDLRFSWLVADCLFRNCTNDLNAARLFLLPAFKRTFVNAYNAIKGAAPHARVIVVGYPRIVSTAATAVLHCFPWLSTSEQTAIEAFTRALDSTLASAAAQAGVRYVSTLNALQGHELCTGQPWVNTLNGLPRNHEQGHPNSYGQHALADAARSAILSP